MRHILKLAILLVAVIILAMPMGVAWLFFSPPDGMRSATAYAAKTVCSNVFIAGRDMNSVIASDVALALLVLSIT